MLGLTIVVCAEVLMTFTTIGYTRKKPTGKWADRVAIPKGVPSFASDSKLSPTHRGCQWRKRFMRDKTRETKLKSHPVHNMLAFVVRSAHVNPFHGWAAYGPICRLLIGVRRADASQARLRSDETSHPKSPLRWRRA